MPPPVEPPRDALKERPSGGRDENGLGFAGLGPENAPPPVRGLELVREEAPAERGRERELV